MPSILGRIGRVAGGHWETRQAPTVTQRRNLEIGRIDLAAVISKYIGELRKDLEALEADLEKAGAPWTPGRRLSPR